MNIVVPEVGESIVDARVARWLKNQGDAVVVGEPLVELETDKVDVEVSAQQAGILASIAHPAGDDVKIGEVLGTIGDAPAGRASDTPRAATPQKAAPKTAPQPAARTAAPQPAASPAAPTPARSQPARGPGSPNASVPANAASDMAVTPSARKLARERGSLPPAAAPVPQPSAAPAAVTAAPSDARSVAAAIDGPVERVRLSKRRATIARRLVEAQQTAAMLTTFNEVDMSAVASLRERQKDAFKTKHGVSLGLTSFFVKAVVAALREMPQLNAEIQGDEMVLKHYYDIGVAVAADEGLVVPVLRGADRMSFAEIETGIRGFAAKAKDGTLSIDDLRGGTFTVTNGGVFGSLMSTPILNPPQVGILGLHAIKERPVGVNGQIVLRPMMYTALTYDHRIVDGSDAVRFLVRVKTLVEDPGVLLVES